MDGFGRVFGVEYLVSSCSWLSRDSRFQGIVVLCNVENGCQIGSPDLGEALRLASNILEEHEEGALLLLCFLGSGVMVFRSLVLRICGFACLEMFWMIVQKNILWF